MTRLISSWFVSSVALALAAWILGDKMNIGDSSDTLVNQAIAVAIVGALFTVVFEFLGPIVKTLGLPFIVLSLGLLLLVINAALLLLVEWLSTQVGVEFEIAGFWWAVLAAVVISIGQSIVSAIID